MQFPRRALFCFILVAAPGWTAAGSLYRCIGAGGQVSYQDSTCDGRARTDRIIEYAAAPASPSASAAARRHGPGSRDARAASRSSVRASMQIGSGRVSRSAECRRAKNRRTRELERLGLARTFDQLSRIDAEVRNVCDSQAF